MDKTILRMALSALMAVVSLPVIAAVAQGQAAPAAPAPAAPAAAPAAPAPAPMPMPMAEPAPAPMPEAAPAPVLEAAPVADAAPAAAPSATTIGGYISTGYSVNFTNITSHAPVPLTPYNPTGHSFILHSAHLNVDHKLSDALLVHVGVDVGTDAIVNEYAYPAALQGLIDVQEAYGAYTGGTWTLTAGKFVTYEGIEVVGAPSNPTVTHGLLYHYAEPVYHTGFKAHSQVTDQINLGIGVVNGWDNIVDNNSMKTIIGAAKFTPSSSAWVQLSASFGSEQPNDKNHRLSVDLTGAATLSDSFVLNFQGNFGMQPHANVATGKTASWFGLGVQPVYTSGDFSFGSRLEWFDDAGGARVLGTKANYIDVTLTPGYKIVEGFKLRADLRADIATEKVLAEKSGLKKAQFLTEVAAEFTF